MSREPVASTNQAERRGFLAAGMAATAAIVAPTVHAAGSDMLKVGLVGCGGRGSGAAHDAVSADPNCKIHAIGDLFPDRLASSYENLAKMVPERIDVPPERRFVGWDAYKKVIDSGIDVVILATPPHFRPEQFAYAVEKNKHAFVEKPVAVDAPGVRSVLETAALAKKKNLAVVSGLCWRYHPAMRETVNRVKDGQVGKIIALQCDYNTGLLWSHAKDAKWSDMEWQVRNWLYFTWLSGDFNVEQHVHSLDKMAWVMGDQYPVKAWGLGGRQQRTHQQFGHIFDHHAVCYEFADETRCFSFCRQQMGTFTDVEDYVFGSDGTAKLIGHTISGKSPWKFRNPKKTKLNMYHEEHKELFASIRAGKPINNGEYMAKSTLMGIMGRMATYTGQQITWDQAMSSNEQLKPASYDFTSLPMPPVAIPGLTKFT